MTNRKKYLKKNIFHQFLPDIVLLFLKVFLNKISVILPHLKGTQHVSRNFQSFKMMQRIQSVSCKNDINNLLAIN